MILWSISWKPYNVFLGPDCTTLGILLLKYYDMSLAIRKRSWEEHVTQWMDLPFGSIDSNILCRHGLVADNLQASMENDGVRSSGQKETSSSLPDCCHGGELVAFPLKLLGNVSKEVDENDNHQEEEDFLSLEASTETLVSVSVEGDYEDGGGGEGEFSLERSNHHFPQVEEEWPAGSSSVERAEPFRKTEPRVEAKKELDHGGMASRKVNEPQCDTIPQTVTVEANLCDSRGESLGFYCDSSSGENGLKENLSQSQENFGSEEKVVRAAVTAQQCRKSETPGNGCEKTLCSPAHGESSGQHHEKNNQAATGADTSDLLPLPGSHLLSRDNGLDSFADSQDKLITSVPLVEGETDLKNSMAICEATDSQVILRKRKVRCENG